MKLNTQINTVIITSMSVFLGISILLSVYSLMHLKDAELAKTREILMNERKTKLRDVVQNAYSVLETANFYEPAQKAISNMRFGENKQNYFYIVDFSGMIWVNPAQPQTVGTNGADMKDAKGFRYIAKIISDAMIKGEGFAEYYDVKPGSSEPSKKLVHFKQFKDWEWVLCADMFVDDIDAILLPKQREIEKAMRDQVMILSFFGFLALVLTASASTLFFRKKLVMPMKQITSAMDKITQGDFDTRIELRASEEINQLVDALERMQNSFAVAYRRLKSQSAQLKRMEASKDEDAASVQKQESMKTWLKSV